MNKRRKIIRAMASAAGGGVKRPASPSDIIQWLTAYDGVTPFVDRKNEVTSPVTTGVNCLSFDGVNDFVDTGLTVVDATESIDITIGVIFASLDGGDGVIGQGAYGGSFGIDIGSGYAIETIFRPADGSLSVLSSFVPTINTPYLLRMTWDGISELRLYEGENLIATNSGALSGAFDVANLIIGKGISGTATNLDGKVFYYKNNSIQTLPFAEGSGNPYDVSGNGNHGTITGATWTTADNC